MVHRSVRPAAIAAIAAFVTAAGSAQAGTQLEVEAYASGPSNDSFDTAQDLGALAGTDSIVVEGSRLEDSAGGSSIDFYKITLMAAATLSVAVDTPLGPVAGNDPLVGLFTAGGVKIADDDDSGPGLDSFMRMSLESGSYYIAVSGYPDRDFTGDFRANGDWSYTLTASAGPAAPPVPEPGTWAMLLAGLAGVSAAARRRT